MQFPTNIGSISVQKHNYSPEVFDTEGRGYFRLPDQYAPELLATGLKFTICDPPEDVDLSGLKAAEVPQSELSVQLQQIQALGATIEDQKNDISALRANLAATLHERDNLKLQVHELSVKVSDLEEEIVELKEQIPSKAKR